ncbi:MAG: hypothetical protein K6E37_02650 [Bacteroidales bacterium]|nr:hypothetical protein [Bacteroidales bacterium]
MIDIENRFGKRLRKIWVDAPSKIKSASRKNEDLPAIVNCIPTPCKVLFIGFNPSYISSQPEYYCPSKMGITYFNELLKLCSDISLIEWGYLDIYPVRMSKQDDLKKEIVNCTFPFFDELEKLTKDIIREASPDLIVVLNAAARDTFFKIYKLPVGFVNIKNLSLATGTFMVNVGGDAPTPVIFSGMLSGQRALDLGSRISLQWHIAKVLSLPVV